MCVVCVCVAVGGETAGKKKGCVAGDQAGPAPDAAISRCGRRRAGGSEGAGTGEGDGRRRAKGGRAGRQRAAGAGGQAGGGAGEGEKTKTGKRETDRLRICDK